jgi:hypothetical protein
MKNKTFYFLLSVLTGMFLLEGGSPREARAQADEDTVRCAQAVSKAMVDFTTRVYEAKAGCEAKRIASSRPKFCGQDERKTKDLAAANQRLEREIRNCKEGALANLCPLGARNSVSLTTGLASEGDPSSIASQLDSLVGRLFVAPISTSGCSPRPGWDADRPAEECVKIISRNGGELFEELQECFADCELKQMKQNDVEQNCVDVSTGAPTNSKVSDCVNKEVTAFFSTMNRKCSDDGVDQLGCPDGQTTSAAVATSVATEFLQMAESLNLGLFHSICRSETDIVVDTVPSSATLLPSGSPVTVSCGTLVDADFMAGNSILRLDSNVNCDSVQAAIDGLMVSATGITIDGADEYGLVGMDRSRYRTGAGIRLLPGATNVTLKNLKSIRRFGVGIADSGVNTGLRIQNVALRRNDTAGLSIHSSGVVIEGLYADRNKIGAILEGDNIVIRDSTIRRCDGSRGVGLLVRGLDADANGVAVEVRDMFFEHNGVGVDLVGSSHRVLYNRVTRSRYSAIESDTSDSLYDGNLLRDSRQGFGLEVRGVNNIINENQSESNGLAAFAVTGNGNTITNNSAGDARRGNGSKGGGITVTGIENQLGGNGSYRNRPTQYSISRYNIDLGGNVSNGEEISFGQDGITVE